MRVVDGLLAAPVLPLVRSSAVRSERVNGMRVDLVIHPDVGSPERTILHIHGGGFVFGSTRTHRFLAAQMSRACRARVVLFDYRLMPGHSIGSSIRDCMTAYEWVAATYRDSPLVLSGDSAGGNLMLTVLSRLHSDGRRLPVAAVGMSAWLDPDYQHPAGAPRDSFFSLRFARRAADLAEPRSAITPLEAALPTVPVLLQCGAEEPIGPANHALVEQLDGNGVTAELQMWERQPHVFQMLAPFTREAVAALDAVDAFLSALNQREVPTKPSAARSTPPPPGA
ncbi:alpha/beta hydrolase [Gordonia humi]|nr:alpha/beta hydrolase [Gordonia humi]